jgi:hypothetical protein
MDPGAALMVLDGGRFKTQFETFTSGGAMDPEVRAISEMQQFNHAPAMPPEKRTVYGYMAPEGTELQESVDQYGPVRFVLKPAVRERTTMTVGDSLSTGAIPIPVEGPVTDEQVIRARALGTIFFPDSPGTRLAIFASPEAWLDEDYAEAQIHGGVSLNDVAEIHVPHGGTVVVGKYGGTVSVSWSEFFREHAATLRAKGIDVIVDGQRLELG